MKQYIPESLDIDELLSEKPPAFNYHRDNFIHILNLITEIPSRNKDLLDANGWVPIHAHTLQSRIRDYDKYLDYLIENKILETDNQYLPGEKSKEYRFTKEHRVVNKGVEIEKYTLIKSILCNVHHRADSEKKYPYLAKWFNPDLNIDYSSATDYLYQEYEMNIMLEDENPDGKYNASMLNAEKFKEHDFYFHVDGTVNRLHTNLTNSKSGLRNFITYGGAGLVSVDIKNSQPWISTLLLDSRFYEKPKIGSFLFNIKDIYPKYTQDIFLTSEELDSIIMIVKNELSLDGKGKGDIRSYTDKVLDGSLYEYIAEEIKSTHGYIISNRKEIKKMIFTVFFSANQFFHQREAWPKEMFSDLYPTVYDVFKSIKRHGQANLAILLQRMESKLMLDYVAKRIGKECPGMPMFTIHDSIVCPFGEQGYVARVIQEEALKCIGSTPSVSVESWHQEKSKIA